MHYKLGRLQFITIIFLAIFSTFYTQAKSPEQSVEDSLRLEIRLKEFQEEHENAMDSVNRILENHNAWEKDIEQKRSYVSDYFTVLALLTIVFTGFGFINYTNIRREQSRVSKLTDEFENNLESQQVSLEEIDIIKEDIAIIQGEIQRRQEELNSDEKLRNAIVDEVISKLGKNKNLIGDDHEVPPREDIENILKEDFQTREKLENMIHDAGNLLSKKYLSRAKEAYNAKNWIIAIESIDFYMGLTSDEISHEVLFEYGFSKTNLKRYYSAIHAFRNALEIKPDYCYALFGLYYCYKKNGAEEASKIKQEITDLGCDWDEYDKLFNF